MAEITRQTIVKDELSAAFLDLLKQKPFLSITVTELVKKAGVARASFYRNFNTTGDVMDYFLDKTISSFLTIALPIIEDANERTWRDFLFQYIYFLLNSESSYIQIRSDNMSVLFNGFISKARERKNSMPKRPSFEIYTLAGKLSLINGILISWKENGMVEPVEVMVDFIYNIISSF